MKLYFDDREFDQQFQRSAAKAPYACCDLGEIFAIAARITPGDYDSWYREWFAAGDANQKLAEAEAASGHTETACQAFLRASEYYRSAYFYCRRDVDGQALLDAFRACRDMFLAAAPYLPYPTEAVQIPFEDVHLSAYIMKPRGGEGPTLLWPAGYDSPVEEFYSLGAGEAAARGFTVVTFDGPGQGGMLYEHNVPFRPDFEAVTGPVIDFVESRSDLDAEHLAMRSSRPSFETNTNSRAKEIRHASTDENCRGRCDGASRPARGRRARLPRSRRRAHVACDRRRRHHR